MISEETFLKAHGLVMDWEGKENYNVPAHIIREIFNVHNEIFWENKEHSVGCGGCRSRVWGKLKAWYHENKHLYGY